MKLSTYRTALVYTVTLVQNTDQFKDRDEAMCLLSSSDPQQHAARNCNFLRSRACLVSPFFKGFIKALRRLRGSSEEVRATSRDPVSFLPFEIREETGRLLIPRRSRISRKPLQKPPTKPRAARRGRETTKVVIRLRGRTRNKTSALRFRGPKNERQEGKEPGARRRWRGMHGDPSPSYEPSII